MGVPIPDDKMMIGVKYDVRRTWYRCSTTRKLSRRRSVQQEAKVKAYKILQAANLPIPPDLKAEVECRPQPCRRPTLAQCLPALLLAQGGGRTTWIPWGRHPDPLEDPARASSCRASPAPLARPAQGPAGVPGGGPPPISPNGPGAPGNGFAPPASFERRPGMPTASSTKESSADSLTHDETNAKVGSTRIKRRAQGGHTPCPSA
jgi:hypothetical protein